MIPYLVKKHFTNFLLEGNTNKTSYNKFITKNLISVKISSYFGYIFMNSLIINNKINIPDPCCDLNRRQLWITYKLRQYKN